MGDVSKAKSRGVVYLAFGRPYLAMALYSRMTLAESNPSLSACIITNIEINKSDLPCLTDDDYLVVLDGSTSENRLVKTSIVDYSPFDETFFIDCDTVIMSRLDHGFEYVRFFDVCVRLNPYPQTRKGKADIPLFEGLGVGDCPHWNSGVLIFRKTDAAKQFFRDWAKNFKCLGNKYDQVSLVKAVFESSARFLSLDGRWNAVDPFVGRRSWQRRTKIFHYATNISDRLLKKVVDVDKKMLAPTLDGNADETHRFLVAKRKTKLAEHGHLRYLLLRSIWKFTSPV